MSFYLKNQKGKRKRVDQFASFSSTVLWEYIPIQVFMLGKNASTVTGHPIPMKEDGNIKTGNMH
jgi:hypothetical protein